MFDEPDLPYYWNFGVLTVGEIWGTFPTRERRAELKSRLVEWAATSDHGDLRGPFDSGNTDYLLTEHENTGEIQQWSGSLTGADVFYLAVHSVITTKRVHDLDEALSIMDTSIEVPALHLEGASFNGAQLDGAHLSKAHLEYAYLSGAQLRGALLEDTHLEGAFINSAHLEGARLYGAHLEDAYLEEAHLEGALLNGAHLEGTGLYNTRLAGASLRLAYLDASTRLDDAVIWDTEHGPIQVADTRWQGANLAIIQQWSEMDMLGDEQYALQLAKAPLDDPNTLGRRLPKRARRADRRKAKAFRRDDLLTAWRDATRANRQLAAVMREQGMNDEADHFAYRGQLCQRRLQWLQRKRGAWAFSMLLWATAGYGYRLRRILFAYGLMVLLFAAGYFVTSHALGAATITWQSIGQGILDALQISLNAIHGRVFFTQFGLDTVQSWLATLESIFGIVIEGIFVAMLIQRFFGK